MINVEKSKEVLFLSEILKKIDTGILIIDGQEIIYANEWIFKKSGYTKKEFYGKENFAKFITNDYKDMVLEYNKRRSDGDTTLPTNYEIKTIIKDGSFLWLDCNVSTVNIDGNVFILFFMKDVTPFKKTEENYVTVFELSPDAISISKILGV